MPDNTQYATNTITVVNDFIGMHARFETKKIMDRMLYISGLGGLIKDIITIAKGSPPNPVLVKLDELQKNIFDLSKNMSHLFDDLKAFMVAHSFYRKFATAASTLMKLQQDTISNPCDHSMGIFRQECERTPPLRWALDFISELENDNTNPLKMAMNSDPLKSRVTFKKWRDIIDGVLGQFLFLETYLNGMFWDSNMYGPNRLKDRIETLNDDMDQWRTDYHKKNEGWGGVEDMVKRVQNENSNCANSLDLVVSSRTLSDKITQELDNILTYDAYYVLVYNSCGGYGNHAFESDDKNFICSFRKGNCNAVVYRSTIYQGREEQRENLRRAIQDRPPYPTLESYESFIGTLRDEVGRKGKCGFVGMIRSSHNVVVRWLNTDLPNGPGAYTTVDLPTVQRSNGFLGFKTIKGDNFFVIAGIL